MPMAARGNSMIGTASATSRVIAAPTAVQVMRRTRSRRPAPWFWPTMISMLSEMPSVGRKTKFSRRLPAPKAARASVPKGASWRLISSTRAAWRGWPGRRGRPRRPGRAAGRDPSARRRARGASGGCRLNSSRVTSSEAMPKLATVVQAAPATPISGKGPGPKMKSGSSTMFSARARAMVLNGNIVSPSPRKSALTTCGNRAKIAPQ